ncbi:MAG: hypothetical protein R3F35_18425 [Myxococcota bacterium]
MQRFRAFRRRAKRANGKAEEQARAVDAHPVGAGGRSGCITDRLVAIVLAAGLGLGSAFAVAAAAEGAAGPSDAASRFEQLESVRAFDEVMATLSDLRAMILADATSEREAAEGMRFLLRNLAMSQEVSGDGHPAAPHFARMDTPRRKIGGDNPNAEYDNLAWNGDYDYRITGNRGSVDHLSFTVLLRGENGRSRAIGYVNERDLEPDANGDFTLWLTRRKPDAKGVWIETQPGDGSVLVRQYIGDRSQETLATYRVEVVGRKPFDPLPPSTDAEVAHGIRSTLLALNGLGRLHHYVSPRLGESPNGFRLRNSDDFGADISSIDNLYVIGTYEIEEDEALVVEVDRLDVRYWNFAIENPWHESVDYAQRKTSRTHDDVRVDPDGKVRFVIAHARTDHPNYLETAGHRRGFMTFRWVGERDTKAPLPKVTKLPVARAVAEARRAGGGR